MLKHSSRAMTIRMQPLKLVGPALSVCALFYLGFHALNGERGVYALVKESRKLEVLQAELEVASAQRATLEHKVTRLQSGSLDLDLLDEQARAVLGYAAPNEVVYLLDSK